MQLPRDAGDGFWMLDLSACDAQAGRLPGTVNIEHVNPCEKDLPNRFTAIRLSALDNKIELQGVVINWRKMI
jgi:hypothetical protein